MLDVNYAHCTLEMSKSKLSQDRLKGFLEYSSDTYTQVRETREIENSFYPEKQRRERLIRSLVF